MKNKILKVLKFLGRRVLFWLFIGALAGLLTSLLELAISIQLQVLLKALGFLQQEIILPGGFRPPDFSVTTFSIVLIVIGILKGIASFLIVQSSTVANELLNSRLKLLAFYETLCLKTGFISLSQINTKIGELFPKATNFCYYIALLLPILIHSTLLMVFMFINDWRSTLIGLAGLFVVAVLVFFINLKVHKVAKKVPAEYEALTRGITRVMRNWFLLKALHTTDNEYRGLVKSSLSYSTHSIRATLLVNTAAILPPIFGVILLALLIALHVKNPMVSSTSFLAFLYLFLRFVQMQSSVANYFGNLTTLYPHFKSSIKYFLGFDRSDIYRAVEPARLLQIQGKNIDEIHKTLNKIELNNLREQAVSKQSAPQLEVKNLCFRFSAKEKHLFENLSFTVQAGEHLGIIDRSGTGKSTLLGLLMGVLEPSMGDILIDGFSPKEYFEEKKHKIAYVGAEPFLIEGTIKENMLYGSNREYDYPAFEKALKAARLFDWFQAREEGLLYHISENGEGLSTGQKQRLSLARALLSEPTFLILDEVSANLDETTELEIADTVRELSGKCTALIVSHRSKLLKHANKIIILE